MSKINLFWVDNGDELCLRAGALDIDLVTLTRVKRWWEAYSELPGVSLKQYGLLAAQQDAAERAVRAWFGQALEHEGAEVCA